MAKAKEIIIECPFYYEHGKFSICCEGLCGSGQTTHSFNSSKELQRHISSFCGYLGGRKCPHFRAVSLLYERGLRH